MSNRTLFQHPFFAQSGSIQCIRSLISEVNAEQITTEVVVGSDDEVLYDDDDDDTATVSSMTTVSEVRVKHFFLLCCQKL